MTPSLTSTVVALGVVLGAAGADTAAAGVTGAPEARTFDLSGISGTRDAVKSVSTDAKRRGGGAGRGIKERAGARYN